MKQQISFAVACLVSSTAALNIPGQDHEELPVVHPLAFHYNEDPHSVPDPMSGEKRLTATQAKYLRKETWDTDTEDTSIDPNFHGQFNWRASEPGASWMQKNWGQEMPTPNGYVQLESESDSDSDSSSDSDSDSEDEKEQKPTDKKNVQW